MAERGEHAAADPLLYQALTGGEQEWLGHCRKVAAGNLRVATRHFGQDGVELRSLREFGDHWLADGERSDDSYESSAAAVMGALALALANAAPADEAAGRLVAHMHRANLVSVGTRPVGTGAGEDAGRAVVRLIEEADPTAAGFGELAVQSLLAADALPAKSKVTVPVLFGGGEIRSETYGRIDRGVSGKLVLERLRSGPPGMHPHPATMVFLHASDDFIAALRHAWTASPLSRTDACVVWSLLLDNDASDPVNKVKGGSLGGAFAVGLDELSRRSGAIGSFLHRRLLDPSCAVSATVDEEGRLGEVSSLDDKLAAAGRAAVRRLVVAPPSLRAATDAVRAGSDIEIHQAATVKEAVAAVRNSRNPRFRWTAALATVVVMALIGVGIVGYNGHVGTFASNLATQAVTLANRNPRLAAAYALAADSLRPTAESRDAKNVVAANNRFVAASAEISSEPVRSVASDGETVLVSDGSTDVTVLTYPGLQVVGTLEMQSPHAQLAYRETNQEFVAVDAGELKFYAGEAGRLPVLVQTMDLGLKVRFESTEDIFGPYVDQDGGVLVLSQSMRGAYWSPSTQEMFRFDLRDDEHDQGYGNTLVAASGFAFNPGESDPGEMTNAATDSLFYIATNRGDVLQLHLSRAEHITNGTGEHPDVWLGSWFRNSRGTRITALGWLGESLLVGTDAGLSSWDRAEYEGSESAFPFAGVARRVEAIASIRSYSDVYEAAVLTPDGVELVSTDHASALNGTTAASSADTPVTSITSTGAGTWITGRANGAVVLVDPGHTPLSSGGMFSQASAAGMAADGRLLLSTGRQQVADGVARYELELAEEGDAYDLNEVSRYAIGEGTFPSGVFLNDVTGDAEVVVAGGKRHPYAAAGTVLVWRNPESQPLVLDFPADLVTEGLDMVTAVAYAPRLRLAAGFNLLQGAVGVWDVDSGDRVHTVQLRKDPDGDNVDGRTRMTASADGESLAVAMEDRVSVIDVESGTIRSSFDSGNVWALLSPDGQRLALAATDKITFTGLDGSEQAVIHVPGYSQAEWSPDGTVLAVAFDEARQIAFFDTRTFRQIGLPWSNPSGLIPADLMWSGDGTKLLVANASRPDPSGGGSAVYEAKGVDVLEPASSTFDRQLCALIGGGVTDQEWREAGGSLVPMPDLCPSGGSQATEGEPPAFSEADWESPVGDLRFAPVPPIGIHRAGELYFGRLPLEPVHNGYVNLTGPGLSSSIAGTRETSLAVFDNSAGGVGWPQVLVLYGDGPEILAWLDLGDAVSAEHVQVESMEPTANGVLLRLSSYAGAGFEVRDWTATLRYADGRLDLHDLVQVGGPPTEEPVEPVR